jgi:hypothetical protein
MRRLATPTAVLVVGLLTSCGQQGAAGQRNAEPETAQLAISSDSAIRPDPVLTPGASFVGVTAALLCSPGYATTVSSPNESDARYVFDQYNRPYPASLDSYRLDRLIPVGLGGSNSTANYWPEPLAQDVPRHKDELAVRLQALVCAGSVPLETAQREVATDWYAAWLKYQPSSAGGTKAPDAVTPSATGPSVATPPSVAAAGSPGSTAPGPGPLSPPGAAAAPLAPTAPGPGLTSTAGTAPYTAPPTTPLVAPSPPPIVVAPPPPPQPAPAPPTVPVTRPTPTKPATSTPTKPAVQSPTAPATSTPRTVVAGTSCSPAGATGVGAGGARLVCRMGPGGLTWG